MKTWRLWRGIVTTLLFVQIIGIFLTSLAFKWSGHINIFLGVEVPTEAGDEDAIYYDSEFGLTDEGLTKMLAASDKHDVQTMEEGTVLLKNDNNALPLKNTERNVTLFGRAVADPVYRGNSGGPSLDGARLVSLQSALVKENFNINETIFNAYKNSPTKRVKNAFGNAIPSSIGEEPISFYTDLLKSSYANNYNDVAIVMFARDGGEGMDLLPSDADGISQLALHPQEADLLKLIKEEKDKGIFKKVIVLINSGYPMELKWLEDAQYGVDSALWIGGPGLKGFEGVANVLVGKADPSGRLTDVYATNSLSSPAVQNAFDNKFSNHERNYVVQLEGIYTGYKYYETRYQDAILGINNASGNSGVFASSNGWKYEDEMAYPFGYGSSYANFKQELINLEWDRTTRKVTAEVKVTNLGYPDNSSYTGKSKSVVQLYVQLPYQSGQAQKAAIQLIDFEKTSLLGAGESETVKFETDDYLFATYDNTITNSFDTSKKGSYVFDAGAYRFAIGDNSHDALNNVLKSREVKTIENAVLDLVDHKGNVVTGDAEKVKLITLAEKDTHYAKSQFTGKVVSNLFDDIDINYFLPEGEKVTYLTRDDWNTFPNKVENLTATTEMLDRLKTIEYTKPADAPAYDSFKQGEDVTIKLIEMKDVPYDDPKWEEFLNQFSIRQLTIMVGEDFGHPAIPEIGKPHNSNTDGPDGTQGVYKYGSKSHATVHVNQIVAASTWNKELLEERGKFLAEDALFVETSQLWSPGANLHRTPFSGRNFEYYSEDAILTYILSSKQTKAMQDKGLNASIKHFAGNDQETNRDSLNIFLTEQAFRQGSLKGFEGAFTVGEALGTMMSFTAVGSYNSFYVNKEILTGVVRNEWGFKGITLTDASKGDPINTVQALVAGTDSFNVDTERAFEIQKYLTANKDGNVLKRLREANKNFYYSMLRTNMMNGITVDTIIKGFTPWWQTALIILNVGVGVITLGSVGMFVYSGYILPRKKDGDKNNENTKK